MLFDILPQEKGDEIARSWSADKMFYHKVDISDADTVSAACTKALEQVPKGSLFGGVHCAALNKSREWSGKMMDSAKDFRDNLLVNGYGTFVVDSAIADAINSQYEDTGRFGPRVTEERGCIVNIASAVAGLVPARCLTYGPTKSECLFGPANSSMRLGHHQRSRRLPWSFGELVLSHADVQGIRVCSVSPSIVQSKMLGERWPYFGGELEACAIFPRRAADAMEIVDGIMYLLGNSMMNAFDVSCCASALTLAPN